MKNRVGSFLGRQFGDIAICIICIYYIPSPKIETQVTGKPFMFDQQRGEVATGSCMLFSCIPVATLDIVSVM